MLEEAASRLSEQMRSTKSRRPYLMKRRAQLVDETRQRITDATIGLHTTVGPAKSSIAAIAEAAGVTRLTVYRHFPTLDELFVACRSHWRDEHRPPNIGAWREVPDLADRARRAFGELYAWFHDNSDDLYPNNRDFDSMPASTQATIRAERSALAGALIDGYGAGARGRRLRAVAGHLVAYWTWRSLVLDEGLTNDEAVDLAVRILTDAAG
jgi:AcrR family transcriptional regulator